MTLLDLRELTKDFKPENYSAKNVDAIQKAISDDIGLGTFNTRVVVYSRAAVLGLLILFVAATGTIAVGAAVKWWTVDPDALNRLWTTFFSSGGVLGAGWVVDALKNRRK